MTSREQVSGNEDIAKAYLTIAQQYHQKDDTANEIATLQAAREKCLPTDSGGEIRYKLGSALYSQGQSDKALNAFQQMADTTPESPYAPSALYFIGTYATGDDAVKALRQLSVGPADRKWKGLAYAQLAKLTKATDIALARDYYLSAIEMFNEYSASNPNQPLIEAKIQTINAELALLDKR